MGKALELTGQKFNRLTVIKRVENNKRKQTMWLCKCSCGNETTVLGKSLKNGDTQSCGCLQKEKTSNSRKLQSSLAAMRQLISNYKANAKRRGIEYELIDEEFKEITQKPCHYCGARPNNIGKYSHCNGNYIYNGMDRVDNAKGYMMDNVVTCCKTCNSAKGQLTMQEFQNWINQIYHYSNRGGKLCEN